MSPARSWFAARAVSFAAFAALVAVLGFARPSSAQTWNEVGDAGDGISSFQFTAGLGQLTTINGTLTSDSDIDLYCVRIDDISHFYARIGCADFFSAKDLWLFTTAGQGVELNDGCQSGFVQVTGPGFVFATGAYLLGISGSEVDANSSGGIIWAPGPFPTQRAPDGVAPLGVLNGWVGSPVVTPPNTYSITLAACSFCDQVVPSMIGTWGRVKASYR